MNAVIYYGYGGPELAITGALIDVFEYFIAMYEYNKEVKLLLVQANKHAIKKMILTMENRYDLSDLKGYEENILSVSWKYLLHTEFENTLVVDLDTISKTRGILRSKNLFVISDNYTDDPKYMYSKDLYNVTYYGEMPFHYKDISYRVKLLLHRFKPLREVKEAIYINFTKSNSKNFDYKELNLPNKPILFKSSSHLDNLFEQFDTYVYYHSNKWFDPRPRMFIECTYYDKSIYYINNYDIKDGSYYRYKDVQEHGIKGRELTKNDEIVREFI